MTDIYYLWYSKLYGVVAKKGYLEHMKFLHKTNCAKNAETAYICDSFGNTECLEFALSINGLHGQALPYAITNTKHYDLLKKHGLIDDAYAYKKACQGFNFELLKHIHENSNTPIPPFNQCFDKYGYTYPPNNPSNLNKTFEIVKYLHENKCDWSGSRNILYDLAAFQNNKKLLNYLVDNDLPIHKPATHFNTFINSSSCHKDLYFLKWSFAKGHHVNIYSYTNAAREGNLEGLKYLFENDKCEPKQWDYLTTKIAIQSGNIEC